MSDLLTVKQLQALLQVDRVTIYRMLGEGRLPGFKVGGQWRFARKAIDEWLSGQQPQSDSPPAPDATETFDHEILPISCLQAIQDIFSHAANVGTLTTDLAGSPLTAPSHSADFCRLIQSTPLGRARCQASWKTLSDQPGQTQRCHAGLCYICRPVEVDQETIALVFCGQYLLADDDLPTLDAPVEQCGLESTKLCAAAARLPKFTPEQLDWLTDLFGKVQKAFSHVTQESYQLRKRLSHIADIVTF